jgi:PhnB protein
MAKSPEKASRKAAGKSAKKAARATKKAAKKAAPKPPTKRAKLGKNEYAPLAPYLSVNGAREAVAFYGKAFGAKTRMVMEAEDKNRLMHADLIINGGELMLSDHFPEYGVTPTSPPAGANSVSVHLQVDDADKWWARATGAGCTPVMPLADMFWGDRFGMVKDPFGHIWSIASAIKKKKKKAA